MKVTSKKSITFPGFDWGITAGTEAELPEDKGAQEAILAHPAISKVGESQKQTMAKTNAKDESNKE